MSAALLFCSLATISVPFSQTSSSADQALRWFAVLDGGWSLVMTAAWATSAQSYRPLNPEGVAGVLVPRFLYGTSWTVVLATNATLLSAWAGPNWNQIRSAQSRHDWMLGHQIPGGCGGRGCGFGLGGYGEVSVRLDTRWPWELAMSGGWIQGHHGRANGLTLVESTWVQAPIIARLRPRLQWGALEIEAVLGAGIYFGLHNAHAHSNSELRESLRIPYHELMVLHGGVGPGAHLKAALGWVDTVRLELDLDLAPFVLGGENRPNPTALPLAHPAARPLGWRRAAVGLILGPKIIRPFRVGVRYAAFELSNRPWHVLGHRAWTLSFVVPLDLQTSDP